jgi:hypothetical protein
MKLVLPLLLFGGLSKKYARAYDLRQLRGFKIPIPTGGGGTRTSQPLCPVGEWMKDHYTSDTFSFRGATPNGLFCGPEDGATCAAERVSSSPDDEVIDYEFSCTQCDLTYPDAQLCTELSCLTYECLQKEELVESATSRNRKGPDTVTVCEDYTRSEFFTQTGMLTSGSCATNEIQRILTKHYTEGVSNVRKVSWVLKSRHEMSKYKVSDTFESCEVLVDDVQCNSCEMCPEMSIGTFAADCENIAAGATVSCGDWNSFKVLEVSPSALVLEENVTFPVQVIQHELYLTGNAEKKMMAGYYIGVLFTLGYLVALDMQ